MQVNSCGTCKHWTLSKPKSSIYDEHGLCNRIVEVGNGLHAERDFPKDEMAIACDSEGHHAWLLTKKDFVCILHRPLTSTSPSHSPSSEPL